MAGCVGLFSALQKKDPALIKAKHDLYMDAVKLKSARVVPVVGKVSVCMGGDESKGAACTASLPAQERRLWDQYIGSYLLALHVLNEPAAATEAEKAAYQVSYHSACALVPISEPLYPE